ncbi:MAG: hypothetical protein C0480_01135 [Bradyrhizobium sp.]|nr:hypothetical protein [Bradyrhizobium sp.]
MTDEQATIAHIERNGLCAMLLVMAIAREVHARATGDQRFADAAAAIRKIEATLHTISDDTLLMWSGINDTSEGALSALIGLRLNQVGVGVLPLYDNAAEFFQPISDKVDDILRNARPKMH